MSRKEEKKIMIPHVSVNPNYICIYNEPDGGRNYSSDAFNRNKVNLQDNDTKGIISQKASKRINQALSWFTALSADRSRTTVNGLQLKHRLSFITLTLSDDQKHSDQFIKQRMLNWFLNEMKLKFSVTSYLWRAEAQENGRIHFHVVTNRYIHHTHIRKTWNSIQANFGYTQKYIAAHPDKQPPSTEIKAVYKCNNVAGYLSKYVSKDVSVFKFTTTEPKAFIKQCLEKVSGIIAVNKIDQKNICKIKFETGSTNFDEIKNTLLNCGCYMEQPELITLRPIKGRLWFLSTSLSKLKNASEPISSDNFTKIAEEIKKGVIKAKTIISDYATTFVFPVWQYLKQQLFEDVNTLFEEVEHNFIFRENWEYAKVYWKSKAKMI